MVTCHFKHFGHHLCRRVSGTSFPSKYSIREDVPLVKVCRFPQIGHFIPITLSLSSFSPPAFHEKSSALSIPFRLKWKLQPAGKRTARDSLPHSTLPCSPETHCRSLVSRSIGFAVFLQLQRSSAFRNRTPAPQTAHAEMEEL